MTVYHIVNFHADGGQMCIPGRRCFTDSEKASEFADKMRAEPGHYCGPESVTEETSDTPLKNEGIIYPGLHESQPPLPSKLPQQDLVTSFLRFVGLRILT